MWPIPHNYALWHSTLTIIHHTINVLKCLFKYIPKLIWTMITASCFL